MNTILPHRGAQRGTGLPPGENHHSPSFTLRYAPIFAAILFLALPAPAAADPPAPNDSSLIAGPVSTSAPAASPATPAALKPTDPNARPLGTPRPAAIRPAKDPASPPADPGAAQTILNNPIVRTGLSLGLVLGLIMLLAAVARKYAGSRAGGGLASALGPGGRSPAGLLEVLGRYPLARGQTLVLLKIDRRVLLLCQSGSWRLRSGPSMSVLSEITDPEEVASILVRVQEAEGESTASKFRGLLSRFDSSHDAAAVFGPSDDGSIHLRHVHATAEGDRAELWDESAGANALTIPPSPASGRAGDSVGLLRRRLNTMRSGGGGGPSVIATVGGAAR